MVGGISPSKFSFLLASRPAVGVRIVLGVQDHVACAGLGVTLTKSAKLKLDAPGVLGPKPRIPVPPIPGVM